MKKKNIIIVESSVILAEGLQSIIESSPEFKVTKTVRSLSSTAISPNTDILIVNPRLIGDFQLSKTLQDWRDSHEDMIIFALQTSFVSTQELDLFDGTIELDDEVATLLSKLRKASAKESRESGSDNCELSTREKDVLVLVAKGLTNKEIADQLNISIHTVIAHRKNITSKTNIKSISGLTIYALLNNLISENEIR